MKNQHVNENYAIAINRLQKLKDGFWFSPINKFAVFWKSDEYQKYCGI